MNQELPSAVKKAALVILGALVILFVVPIFIPPYKGAGGPDALTLVVFGPVVFGVTVLLVLALVAARSYHQAAKTPPGRGPSSRTNVILLTIILLAIALGVVWLLNAPLIGP